MTESEVFHNKKDCRFSVKIKGGGISDPPLSYLWLNSVQERVQSCSSESFWVSLIELQITLPSYRQSEKKLFENSKKSIGSTNKYDEEVNSCHFVNNNLDFL